MSYLRKYLYSYGGIILLFTVISLFFLFAAPNFFAKYKNALEQNLSRQFNQKILIGKLNYLPPNFIILYDTCASGYGLTKRAVSFSIKKIKLSFSLKEFLFKDNFVVTRISFAQPAVYFPDIPKVNLIEYVSSVYTDIKQFIAFISPLIDRKIMKFAIKGGILVLPKTAYPVTNVKIDRLEIRQDGYIVSSGSINSLGYNFNGSFGQKGLVIDNITFKKINCYAKFWGGIVKDTLHLNGFAFLGVFSDYLATEARSKFGVANKVKDILAYLKGPGSGIIWLSSFGRFNIFDLDCAVKFSPTDIKIEKLNFNANNTLVFIRGGVSFLEKSRVNFKAAFYRNQVYSNRVENLNKFEFDLLGELWEGAFDGKLKFAYPKRLNNKILYEKSEARLKKFSIYLDERKHVQVLFDEGEFEYFSAMNLYKLSLNEFKGVINYKDKKVQLIFASLLYDGFLKGQGLLDFQGRPFKGNINMSVKGVSVNALSPLLSYLSSFSGKVDSRIYAFNYPEFNLGGNAEINRGAVENLRFLDWLEDFFGMDSFRKMDFDKLSAQFFITDKVSALKAINLDSENLDLQGNFASYNSGLVSGKFFLSISQELLKGSDKFKPLLGILGKDMPIIDFDFQLSGVSEAMNFKWLVSDFKSRLQYSLPGFMERGIERKIEEALRAISEK